jgi:hypothetical protein
MISDVQAEMIHNVRSGARIRSADVAALTYLRGSCVACAGRTSMATPAIASVTAAKTVAIVEASDRKR